jgi:hypothetical protein
MTDYDFPPTILATLPPWEEMMALNDWLLADAEAEVWADA